MRYLYTIILTIALSVCYGQQIPLYYLKADTTNDIILMVKNNELVLVSQDSLTAGNPTDEISTIATLRINGSVLEIATTSINGGTTLVDTTDLSRFYKDSSSTNEIQLLTKVDSVISLSVGGGTVKDVYTLSGTYNQVARELQFTGVDGLTYAIDISAIPRYSDLYTDSDIDGTEAAFAGWDKDASNDITDDGADQYNNVSQKVDPVGNDRLLIEDSADSWNKKYIKLDSLLGGGVGGGGSIWDSLANGNIYRNDSIGVMNIDPQYPVHIGDGGLGVSADAAVVIDRGLTTGIGNGHGFVDLTEFTRANDYAYASYDARGRFSGAGNFDHYAGYQSDFDFYGTDTLGSYYGSYTRGELSQGHVNNWYGSFYETPSVISGGTIDNYYGLYIDNPTSNATNGYQIWSNYGNWVLKDGRFSVNKSTIEHHLDVFGTTRLNGQLYDVNNVTGSAFTTPTLYRDATGLTWGDLHAQFDPQLEWPSLTDNRIPYGSSGSFAFDADLTFDGSELSTYDFHVSNKVQIEGATRVTEMYQQGGEFRVEPTTSSNQYFTIRDHLDAYCFHLYYPTKESYFYGPVRLTQGLKDDIGGLGTSSQALSGGATGIWTDNDWSETNELQTLSIVGSDLTISGGNTVTLPSGGGGGGGDVYKSGTPVDNQHAVWVNDSTVEGSSVLTDNGSDITMSGHLGLDGQSPNGSYSIWAGGNVLLGTGSNYTYITNNGLIQLRNSGTNFDLYNQSGIQYWKSGGVVRMEESGGDFTFKSDVSIDDHLGVNVTRSTSYPLRIKGNGNTYSTSAIYLDNSSSTKLMEIRDDGYGEGVLFEDNIYTLSAGVVPSNYVYGDYTANAYINNVLYNATDRFNVTATNTSNTNYFEWFDGGYTIGGCDLNNNDTSVVSIELDGKGETTTDGLTYPQGRIVVATYTTHTLSANTHGRWKDRNGTWTSLTYNGEVFNPDMDYNGDAIVHLYEFVVGSGNYLTDIELSLVNDNGFDVRVLSIEYYPERSADQAGLPYISKYRDETTNTALTFRDDSNDDQVVIDPSTSTPLVVEGDARFNRNIQDSDGDVGNANQILTKDDVTANEMDYVDFHDFNSFMKLKNTASSINLNTVGVTDVSEISVTDFSYGRDTMINTGDIQVQSQGVYNCKAVLHLTSLDTASIDLRFYEDGSIVTGGKIYTVHFIGAQDQTVVMDETFQLDALDDIDIRSTRNGSATGTVTISATEQAYLQVELKHRGH